MKNTKAFPFFRQTDSSDCGPTCLRMIFSYYGLHLSSKEIINNCEFSRDGVTMLSLGQTAERFSFDYYITELSLEELQNGYKVPCILHWNKDHYVVLTEISQNKFKIADPAKGTYVYDSNQFSQFWQNSNFHPSNGIAMIITPSDKPLPKHKKIIVDKLNWKAILETLLKHPRQLITITLVSLLLIAIQYFIPKLGATLVDKGITGKSFNTVILVLISQFVLIISQALAELWKITSTYILSTTIGKNFSIHFWEFLFKKPLSYFEARTSSRILGLIGDIRRIESVIGIFLSLFVFGIASIITYSVMLYSLNSLILYVVLLFSTLYFLWTLIFYKKIRSLDFEKFELSNAESNKTIQYVQGVKDILLFGNTGRFIREWEQIREKVLNAGYRSLKIEGYQKIGALCITQFRNITVTLLAAESVINSKMSIGELVAVQLIIGQLQIPIDGLFTFLKSAQETSSSLARVNEVLETQAPEFEENQAQTEFSSGDIIFKNLTFKYPGNQKSAIESVSTVIEQGKFTAIVGPSGSGKSTLLKILGRFFNNYTGSVTIGKLDISSFNLNIWREKVGFVSQESYLFDDTVKMNIKMNRELSDDAAISISKISMDSPFQKFDDFAFSSEIGPGGGRLSGGQRQRIILARCLIYNPEILLLDEATNSLDNVSEKLFYNNLSQLQKDKTIIVVAHRLNSIVNADKIIVMDQGKILDHGTHNELMSKCPLYRHLFENE